MTRDEKERPAPRKTAAKSEVPHEERRRLLLERLERTALRSACSGIGDPEGVVETLYVVELVQRLLKGESLPPREARKPEVEV